MNQIPNLNRKVLLNHTKNYSSRNFWAKLAQHAKKIGYEGAKKGIILWQVLQRPDVPLTTKALITGALAYLCIPTDLIFDVVPIVGYSDDLAALAYVYAEAGQYVDGNMKHKANAILNRYF